MGSVKKERNRMEEDMDKVGKKRVVELGNM